MILCGNCCGDGRKVKKQLNTENRDGLGEISAQNSYLRRQIDIPMTDYLLQVEHVSKAYAGHRALDDVSLSVPRGSVYGLLGPNGAGKTTLIRIINRITAPDAGTVVFDGHPLAADDVARIGYMPEERGLYKKMQVGEQAIFFARLKGLSRADAIQRLHVWFERLEIDAWWNRRVEELSKGMAQKVQFVITVLHNPLLLIFDEPFSGFDPINAMQLKREILRLRDEGATVIFSTHNMSSVDEVCDYITLIHRAHNILSGEVQTLRKSYGENRYCLTYQGDRDALCEALQPHCRLVEHADRADGTHILTVELPATGGLRDVIAVANARVTLQSLCEVTPTMNDIFMNAVNGVATQEKTK
jgi:ABC-2 type transport system ATP-binding protein